MMSSFGYRPSNAIISEGSGPKVMGNSRIAKPSSLTSMTSVTSQESGIRSVKEGVSNTKKCIAYSRPVKVVSDDNSPNNRIKVSNNSISSMRRCDSNEDFGEENAVADNHINDKAVTKNCYSINKTPAIAGEGRMKKQQGGTSRIARVDRLSLGVNSSCSYGKIEPKASFTEDQTRMEGSSFYENGYASGLRKPLVSALPVHVEESSKSSGSGLAARACKVGSERALNNSSAVDRGDQLEVPKHTGNSNEANKVNIAAKKPLQSKIPGKTFAVVKSQMNSSETTTTATQLKKLMYSSTASKSIVKGAIVSNKSDCADSKMGSKISEKQIGGLKGRSKIMKPTEMSVGTKSLSQENLKHSSAMNVEESTGSVLTSRSATTKIITSSSAAPRKSEYLRYNEREEIKPRALADANKGQVVKATTQKSRPKIIKEGLVAKRTGQGSKPVDCNLQKKQCRESASRRGIQGAHQEPSSDEGGELERDVASIVSVTNNKAGKAVQGETETNDRENYGSLETVSFNLQGIKEENMSLVDVVSKKDIKKVTFNEKATIKKAVDARDINHGHKKREEIEEVRGGKEKSKGEFNRVIANGIRNETGDSQSESAIRAEGDSKTSSFSENHKRKAVASTFTDVGKPGTKAELVEGYDNRKNHVEEIGAWQQKHCIQFVECDKSKDVLYEEDHNNARPCRSVHVLVDEIVYKSKHAHCPPEGILQTFSDQDFPASVEKNRVCHAGSDREFKSGSLDRIELRSKGKMKTKQNEHGDTLNVKSFSDPKLTNENLGQGLGSFGKENIVQERERILRSNSIQSIPITEPVIRERVKGNQIPDLSGNGIPFCKSYAVKMESALPNHPSSKSKATPFTSTLCYNTDVLPMDNVEKLKSNDRNVYDVAVSEESISQEDPKITAIKTQTLIKPIRQKAPKTEGIDDKSTVKPQDHRILNQMPYKGIGSEDRRSGAVTRKTNSTVLQHRDPGSDHIVHEANGVSFSKPYEAMLEEKSKQSVSGAAVPPPPPKRTVTRHQGNQLKTHKDFETHFNHADSDVQYSGLFNGLANTIPGERSSEPAMNWPMTSSKSLSANNLLTSNEQGGQLAGPQSCLKTNKSDVVIEENIVDSNSGFCSSEFPVEGRMGQNSAVHARPKMPPRDSKGNVCGVPNERQMSPILEDTRAEKDERSPPPKSGVNGVLLNYGCGMEELKKKIQVHQSGRSVLQPQAEGMQSTATDRFQPRVSSCSNSGGFGMEGSRCKRARSSKSNAEKPKQNSFIASLVRMLQEGRDETKTTSTEAINSYDKTVLVDMQVNQDYDPVGLTDDSYFIDEEDPFYQFSLKQGLHDKHARSFDTCNGRQRNTTSQEVKQSRQWHLSHDSLKTTDCHDGHVIQVHNVYRSRGDYPGDMNDPKSLKPALNSSESEPSDGVMAAKDVKLSEKSISSYADKSSVNEIDVALEGRCETDEVCIRPNKLAIDTSQDFITISSHKDRHDTFPREQQQQPKLSSFSSTASCSKSTAMGNAGRPDSSNDVIGVTDCLETDRIGKTNSTLSLQEDRTAEVRENVRKLAELNLLKNSLKVAQASAKSGKKSSSKRKTKKVADYWWESGQRAVFYSDTEDLRANTDFDPDTCTKRTKYDGAKKHMYDCLRIPEVGNTLENHLNTDGRRNVMDVKGEAAVTAPTSDYYKSVVKNAKNDIIGDQERKADLIEPKSTVEGFHFTRVEMNVSTGPANSPKSKPSAKVKPYTVVDLSTMSALTPEEVDTCLKEVSEAENRSWEKADSECFDRCEAPDTLILPPKGSRVRSNTTAGETQREERGTSLSKNGDMQEFAPLKIISSDDYSQPGTTTNVELSSFRTRSKTAPSSNDQLKKAAKDHTPTSYNKQQSFDVDQSNIICISPTKRKVDDNNPCGNLFEVSSTSSQSMQNMSQEFPPPPSEEELCEKEIERVQTPDWPPIPDSIDSIGNQCLKNVFLGHENPPRATDSGHVSPSNKEIDSNRQVKTCDPHRSLPPIPGVGAQGPGVADVPLAWVSKAMPHGTGPFIPMCQSTEDMDDLIKSHFYDDIDQIRKVAQERAMMIKRLEEEAKVHCGENAAGKVEGRNSLGYMPDLIPSTDDCKTLESGRSEAVGHVAGLSLEEVSRNANLKGEFHSHEAGNLDSIESQSVTSIGKKNKSKFAKLFRKLYGQKSVDLVECRATPPGSPRKEVFMSKREADRTEIFATPATNRRLFSLSKNRPQRQRTVSETASMKAPCDIIEGDDSRRSKNRTVSIGFRRKKVRKDVKLLYKDDQSLRSLEALKINSDVSSDSGSSTRLSPVASPVLLDSDASIKKYRAPEPPLSQQISRDDGISLQSEVSSELISSNDNLAKDTQPDRQHPEVGKGLTHDERISKRLTNEINTRDCSPKAGETSLLRNRVADDVSAQRSIADPMSTGDRSDEVFHEGTYYNYPPSKTHSDRPTKPPRSESEDKDISQASGKNPPEKPLRRSRDLGLPIKPEPYSSQRSFRRVAEQHDEVGTKLSPSSTSEDESSSVREYQVPFDHIGPERNRGYRSENGDWESNIVKSSASDFCLSGHFRRGNMLYQSDRTMERPSQFRRRGSFSSEVIGDPYYENLRGVSDGREDFLDSYDKLLEIHQDTVKQIAEATVFKCDCKDLHGTDWNDFEICGKMLNYGISSYVTVPVAVKRNGKRMEDKYTAWLRQSFGFLQNCGDGKLVYSVRDVTMHENLLHICQDIHHNANTDEENSDEVPHDIHVKRMLVSKVTPKMSLNKYLALTMDRHARDPESYEKEACLLILQILKGLGHLGKHGLIVDSIDSESVLLSDIHRGVLSPNFSNNSNNNNNSEVLGCPIAMYLALPGLLASSQEARCQAADENSNTEQKADSNDIRVSKSSKEVLDAEKEIMELDSKSAETGKALSDYSVQSKEKKNSELNRDHSRQLVSLIFHVFHASHLLGDDLEEGSKSMDEVPMLPVKSMYSDRLQGIVDKLFRNESTGIADLIRELQIVSFCPLFMENFAREELLVVLNKWRNRRCVDMVTDILKKYSLISLASGLASGGTNSMGLARNCVLECQFLSSVTAQEIANFIHGENN